MIANKLCCPIPNDRSNKFLKCCLLRIFWEFGQFIVTAPDTIVANEKATEATLIIKTSLFSFIANVDAKQLIPIMAFLYCKSNTKDSSEIGWIMGGPKYDGSHQA